MALFTRAYKLQKENPIVLNHLGQHFFFKKAGACGPHTPHMPAQDYAKAANLLEHALHFTEVDEILAETHFLLARVHHANARGRMEYRGC